MRRKTQRRLILALLAVIVGLGVVLFMGSDPEWSLTGAKNTSPQATAERAIKAIESHDMTTALEHFTPPAAAGMYDHLARLFQRCDRISIGEIAMVVTSETEITARVRAIYDITLVLGETTYLGNDVVFLFVQPVDEGGVTKYKIRRAYDLPKW